MSDDRQELLIPEDLKTVCPLCGGVGHKERTSFNDPSTMRMGSCHSCKGKGWIWALDQQEMAERVVKAESWNRELETALRYPRFSDTARLFEMCVDMLEKRDEELRILKDENYTSLYLHHFRSAIKKMREVLATRGQEPKG